MNIKNIHFCDCSTHLIHVAGTRYVAFSFSEVITRRSLVSAPAARPVLHAGVSEVLKLADPDAFVLTVGRGNVVPTGEKTPRELDAIPVPVYVVLNVGVQTVAAVLLPVLVSAEAGLRARRQVERSFNVFEVDGV